jgi:flagella basal body P-ring formation protein FlgA
MMMIRLICLMMLMLVPGTRALAQSVIELRTSARIVAGHPVMLADVARLEGAEAAALAHIIVREGAAAGETIFIDELRRIIDRSGGVNWGRVSLRGSACTLSPSDSAPSPAPVAADRSPTPDDSGRVRHAVMMRIAAAADASLEDLRLTFSPDDDDILNVTSAGRTIEVTPTGLSDRLPVAVRVFEGERIVRHKTIRVGVEVRRAVVVAASSRRRGEVLGEQDVRESMQWLGLAARPARLEQVVGASPRSRVQAGQVVMVEDVAPQVVVSKGEQVTVYCVSGTMVLTMRARATAAARDGEMVLLEGLESKRTFYARMDGRGRAVVNVGGSVLAGVGQESGRE